MIFLEFSDMAIRIAGAPAALCMINMENTDYREEMQFAERAYLVKGNTVTEIKNRYGIKDEYFISDEDKIVLMMRSVLI